MERRAKQGMGALLLIGVIYTILGGIFVALGIGLLLGLREKDIWFIGGIFAGIGSLFLLLGIVFLLIEFARRRRADKLIAAGRYVWGEIVEFVPNYNVTINGRHPYVAVVRHTDGYGTAHIFRSGNLRIYPDPGAVGRQVKVYFEDDTYKHYYVDMEDILPRVVEH